MQGPFRAPYFQFSPLSGLSLVVHAVHPRSVRAHPRSSTTPVPLFLFTATFAACCGSGCWTRFLPLWLLTRSLGRHGISLAREHRLESDIRDDVCGCWCATYTTGPEPDTGQRQRTGHSSHDTCDTGTRPTRAMEHASWRGVKVLRSRGPMYIRLYSRAYGLRFLHSIDPTYIE